MNSGEHAGMLSSCIVATVACIIGRYPPGRGSYGNALRICSCLFPPRLHVHCACNPCSLVMLVNSVNTHQCHHSPFCFFWPCAIYSLTWSDSRYTAGACSRLRGHAWLRLLFTFHGTVRCYAAHSAPFCHVVSVMSGRARARAGSDRLRT